MGFFGFGKEKPAQVQKSPEEQEKDALFAQMMSLIELRRGLTTGIDGNPRRDAFDRMKIEEYTRKIRAIETQLGIKSEEDMDQDAA